MSTSETEQSKVSASAALSSGPEIPRRLRTIAARASSRAGPASSSSSLARTRGREPARRSRERRRELTRGPRRRGDALSFRRDPEDGRVARGSFPPPFAPFARAVPSPARSRTELSGFRGPDAIKREARDAPTNSWNSGVQPARAPSASGNAIGRAAGRGARRRRARPAAPRRTTAAIASGSSAAEALDDLGGQGRGARRPRARAAPRAARRRGTRTGWR